MFDKKQTVENFYEYLSETYQQYFFDYQEQYYDWYRKSRSLEEAIIKAFKSEDKHNKVHCHQHRIGRKQLEIAKNVALNIYKENNYSEINLYTFDKIYDFVGLVRKNHSVYRFGELAHYDVSLRIAKYLNCGNLSQVYLHAGTLEGARAIYYAGHIDKKISSFDIRNQPKVSTKCFPFPLSQLSGDHLENLLCVCKKELQRQEIFNNKVKFCIKSSENKATKSCV